MAHATVGPVRLMADRRVLSPRAGVQLPHGVPRRCHPDGMGSRSFKSAIAGSIPASGTVSFRCSLSRQSGRLLIGMVLVRGQSPERIFPGVVTQLVRVPARQAGSRGFKSRRSRPCPYSSVGERYPDKVEAEAHFLVRVPGSSGETEIMTDYGSVVGGSSPPGSAFG
jgi:hypothetical protein